jgi:DNA-binding transcriptional LysR family regulator
MYDNLNNYKAFYMVAKTGSISSAAEALFISQPAISKSVSKLEQGLQVRLFDRSTKGVKLTDEGEILYSHISSAFDAITKGEDEIHRINELGIGQLKIGVSTSLCKHILLDYLKNFIVENPHIKVIIDCHSTLNTLKLIQDGQIDIGLICETEIPSGYTYHEITSIHDVFVTSISYLKNLELREADEVEKPHNPWLFAGNFTSMIQGGDSSENVTKEQVYMASDSSYTSGLSTKDILEKSNLMMLETGNITRTHINEYLSAQGIYPNQILEVNNMDLLIDFASIGMGVAGVVREFALEYISSGQIIELPVDTPIKERTVGFVYSNSRKRPQSLSKFIDFCNISVKAAIPKPAVH